MIRLRVQDQFRVDRLRGDLDDADAEVLVPASIRCRAGIEQHSSLVFIKEWDVAVTEKRQVHLPAERSLYLVLRRTSAIAMERPERVPPHREPQARRQPVLKRIVVIVPGHGEDRGKVPKLVEHPRGVHIPEVQDKAHLRPSKQIEHGLRDDAVAVGVDVCIGYHADRERRLESSSPIENVDSVPSYSSTTENIRPDARLVRIDPRIAPHHPISMPGVREAPK